MYKPKEDSELLRSVVKKYAKGSVLDMGTGSGIIAKEASKYSKDVLAVDIDPECVEYVKKLGIRAIQSDLFSNINEKFDVIFFNPPYLPCKGSVKYKDLEGGKKGSEVVEKFLRDARKHLKANGKILLVLSSLTSKKDLFKGYKAKVIAKKKLFFEELYVYATIQIKNNKYKV
ncbi:MAG: methyltransferase [archaeon]|nr:MAG: methyltransferase [archaeon]